MTGRNPAGRAPALRIGRRPFLAGFACSLAALPLGGCFEPETGPVEIRYDRQACDFCRMIISDPRFATEIRGGPKNKVFFFDDLGDAVHFLNGKDWKDDPTVEIWVMDMEDGKTWLDARKAAYISGQVTPMDYGYGALGSPREGTVDFAEMQKTILERGPSAFCLPERETSEQAAPAAPKG